MGACHSSIAHTLGSISGRSSGARPLHRVQQTQTVSQWLGFRTQWSCHP